ncbi:MAG: hypothetical protein H7223_09675 [Pedobacter sp.]|nr:hypothetical protein [Pedobacter sp.]
MSATKKSIPVIKLIIVFSLLFFLCSLIYVSFFRIDKNIPLREKVIYTKELRKRTAIKEFVNYVNTQPKINFNRKYLGIALLKLKRAIDAIALSTGYEFQYADLIVAESDIQRIENTKLFSTQSYYLKHAAKILSNSLRKIQRQKFPELTQEANDLRAASMTFNGTDLKLDHDQKIHYFLNKAVDLLNAMR